MSVLAAELLEEAAVLILERSCIPRLGTTVQECASHSSLATVESRIGSLRRMHPTVIGAVLPVQCRIWHLGANFHCSDHRYRVTRCCAPAGLHPPPVQRLPPNQLSAARLTFTVAGAADRGASIRIPPVQLEQHL
jgi:hypothetical protein